MVKIPTYKSESQPKQPITRSRPFINTNPQQVGNAVTNFANQAADLAITVYEKNKRISDDRLQTTTMNDFSIELNDLNNKYKTNSDPVNGAKNYKADADVLIEKYYDKIKDNKHVSEWFFNKSNDMVRGYYPSIESSIFKNNTTRVSEDLTDEKFLFFNTWLNSDKDGNRLVKLQQEDNIFGSDNVVGIYDKLVRKGVPPNLSKEQFNKNLRDELSVLHANQLIVNDLDRFYELYEGGAYNALDPKTKQQLKSSADGQTKKLQTAAATALTADATALKENIKDVIDITKDNYIPNIAEINDLLEKSVNLDAQLKNNGKKGLDSEIQDLTNALDVFNYMANFRTAPMDDLVAEYNAVKNNNVVTSGTEDFNALNVSKEKALESYIDFRKKNEDKNLLNIGLSAGIPITPIDFAEVDSLEPLQTRAVVAVATAELFGKDVPQFFLENERNEIASILAQGSEEDVKNLIVNVSAMSGEFGPAAFAQLSDIDGADGIAHIGTLYNVSGGGSHLDAAIKAYVLRNDKNTQDIVNQYKTTQFEYSNVKTDAFSTFQFSSLFDDRKTYQMLNEATDLIFHGLILSDPVTSKKYDSGLEPTDKAVEHLQLAANIAAGYVNGYGGLEDYNGYKIIVPGVMHGKTYHKNADLDSGAFLGFGGNQTLEEMLDNNMTDELLAQSVNVMPYFSNELTNGGPREATAGDLFNQDKVHLIHYGFGKYTFAYGDSPQTAIAEVRSKDGQLVIFDVTKIYKDINK